MISYLQDSISTNETLSPPKYIHMATPKSNATNHDEDDNSEIPFTDGPDIEQHVEETRDILADEAEAFLTNGDDTFRDDPRQTEDTLLFEEEFNALEGTEDIPVDYEDEGGFSLSDGEGPTWSG